MVRNPVRRFVWEKEVGSVASNGRNSVDKIRKIRENLSKEPMNVDEMNNFGKL